MKNKKTIDKYAPPQPDSKDTAHLVVKAALSLCLGHLISLNILLHRLCKGGWRNGGKKYLKP